jgi:hypothetical protein
VNASPDQIVFSATRLAWICFTLHLIYILPHCPDSFASAMIARGKLKLDVTSLSIYISHPITMRLRVASVELLKAVAIVEYVRNASVRFASFL